MNKGFNIVLPKIQDLMSNPEAYKTLIGELLQLAPKDKVLRFIGGNEGNEDIVYGYDENTIDFFIQLCKDAEVQEVVLRVEIEDYSSGVKHYQDLVGAGLKVNDVEFGNEDYFNIKPTNWIETIFWRIARTRKDATINQAKEYCKKFIEFYNYANSKGIDLKTKLVWNTHFKIDAINLNWHIAVKSELKGFKKCAIHVYCELHDSFFDDFEKSIENNFKGLETIVSEYHPIGYHNLPESEKELLKGSPLETAMDLKARALFEKLGIDKVLKHTLFHWSHYKNWYGHFIINQKTGELYGKSR